MQKFHIHTVDSAPEKSKQPLQSLQKKFGYIPAVAATAGNLADTPVDDRFKAQIWAPAVAA